MNEIYSPLFANNVKKRSEIFKYWLANNILVLPIDKMAGKNKEDLSYGLDETGFAVLKGFFPEGTEKTIKELKERAELSYEPVYRTLSNLTKRKIVSEKQIGKTLVYSLNYNSFFAKTAFYMYATERAHKFSKKHPQIYTAITELPDDKIDILAIFGSYAKGTETDKSDVDIICITPEAEKIESRIKSLRHGYNLDFKPVVTSRKEFAKIGDENEKFWSDLVQYGIIFKGYDLFYSYVYLR